MAIFFIGEGVKKPKVPYKYVKLWLIMASSDFGFKPGDLTFIFCNDEYLKQINMDYLDHDYYTDIVTFDYTVDNVISGDMYISIERVLENAVNFGENFNDELLRVIIHGFLHLAGLNDKSDLDKEYMRTVENKYILNFKKILDERSS